MKQVTAFYQEGNLNRSSKKESASNVLFQKIGNRWYAFTEIGSEIHYAVLPKNTDPKTVKFEIFVETQDVDSSSVQLSEAV